MKQSTKVLAGIFGLAALSFPVLKAITGDHKATEQERLRRLRAITENTCKQTRTLSDYCYFRLTYQIADGEKSRLYLPEIDLFNPKKNDEIAFDLNRKHIMDSVYRDMTIFHSLSESVKDHLKKIPGIQALGDFESFTIKPVMVDKKNEILEAGFSVLFEKNHSTHDTYVVYSYDPATKKSTRVIDGFVRNPASLPSAVALTSNVREALSLLPPSDAFAVNQKDMNDLLARSYLSRKDAPVHETMFDLPVNSR